MNWKRLSLLSSAAIVILFTIVACASSVENLRTIDLSDIIPILPSAVAPAEDDASLPDAAQAATGEDSVTVEDAADVEANVFFVSPDDGAEVTSPLTVQMGATGLDVEPAGEIREGAGHMHILVNEEFVAPGNVILTMDTMLHFGQGQLETTLDLPPGEHVLRLQFADGAHIALDGDEYRDEITVVVK